MNKLDELIELKQQLEKLKQAQRNSQSDLFYWSYNGEIEKTENKIKEIQNEILQEYMPESYKKITELQLLKERIYYSKLQLAKYKPSGYKSSIAILDRIRDYKEEL